MIIKATKKPVTIECVKWDGENIEEIKAFVGSAYIGGENDNDKKIVISTLEGDMLASVGDYIIKGVKGEFYPCKPDIFENTYDIAITKYEGYKAPWYGHICLDCYFEECMEEAYMCGIPFGWKRSDNFYRSFIRRARKK